MSLYDTYNTNTSPTEQWNEKVDVGFNNDEVALDQLNPVVESALFVQNVRSIYLSFARIADKNFLDHIAYRSYKN